MRKFNPLVSIIIPVYNGSDYIADAIESALNQTYKNIEVIVVNDGSTDEGKTEKIIKKYLKKIKYFRKNNGGVGTALNLGIEKMQGDYFSWLSHDDMYTENKIQNQIELLKTLNDKKSIISGSYSLMDSEGKIIENIKPPFPEKKKDFGLKLLFSGNIHGCSILIHNSHFERVGKFDENLPTTQDYEYFFRLLKNQEVYYLKTRDVLSRIHPNQGSKKHIESHIIECNDLWIGIINNVDLKEQIKLYGSKLEFIKHIYLFLSDNTEYTNAINYARRLYYEELKKIEDQVFIDNNIKIFGTTISDIINNIRISEKPTLVFGAYGPWSDLNGLNRVVANIGNGLSKNYNVIVISNGKNEVGYKLNEDITYIDCSTFLTYSDDWKENILYLLNTINTDIYINVYNCLLGHLELSEKIKDSGIKVIAWNHENYFLPYYDDSFHDVIIKRNEIFRKLDRVLWLTSFSGNVYSSMYSNGLIMHNALPFSKKNQKQKEKKNIICAIGRFDDYRKNLEDVLHIAYELKRENDNFEIWIVGEYDLSMKTRDNNKTLMELYDEYKLNNNVIFKGFIDDINLIYDIAKINIMTSYREGFGLTIIEGAQYGIPTVAYNDTGFDDMVNDNLNGYLIERGNYQEFAGKILELIADSKKYELFSKKAKEMSSSFENKIILEKWNLLLEEVYNNNNMQNTNVSDSIGKIFTEYEKVIINFITKENYVKEKVLSLDLITKKIPLREKIRQIIPLKIRVAIISAIRKK